MFSFTTFFCAHLFAMFTLCKVLLLLEKIFYTPVLELETILWINVVSQRRSLRVTISILLI